MRPGRYPAKIWGPGEPGRRLPVRLSWSREIPHRLVFLAGMLLFILIYMQFMRATPGKTTAFAGDTAPETTRTAVVDSSAHARPFQGLLDDAKDGAPIESLDTTKATDPYRTLMWNVKRYGAAEVTSLAETVSAQDLLDAPANWRGRFVRASGVLIKPPEIQRLGQNEAGYEDRWRGYLVDDESGNAIAFDIFEKPEKEFDRTQVVTVEGVFLQVVSYEARGGTKQVPFLEAKGLRPFTGERAGSLESSPVTMLLAAALILAALPVAGYMVSSLFQRKHEADLVAALEKARQRRAAHPLKKPAHWNCTHCQSANPDAEVKCNSCGAPRPPAPPAAPPA